MNTKKEKNGLNISAKSFLTATIVILVLMIFTYGLTFLIPGGIFERITDANGNQVIDPEGAFRWIEGGIPFWKWFLSPILVLGAEGNGSLIAVIAFLLIIGGVFNSLEKGQIMQYMLDKITARFRAKRYQLLAVITLFFMAMGAMIGSFEECIPMVPIVVALAINLGWDAITGLGMSLLAIGCGFASGVCNPFTVGVAQELAGIPMFSGIWLRLLSFVLIYLLLFGMLLRYAKRIQQPVAGDTETTFKESKAMDRALLYFGGILGLGILLVLGSVFITALQDYTMVIVAVMFLAAGLSATLVSGMTCRQLGRNFCDGFVSVLPAVLMILMANSIKYTLVEANILDTILHEAMELAQALPGWAVILFIYAVVLGMNFFIPSGSAKAFLLIPLIVPVAQVFGISAQLCVLAFAFGDGFSNVFYPTNPVLLIGLGLADVNYGKWVRWSGKFQLLNLLLTVLLLLLGLAVGY